MQERAKQSVLSKSIIVLIGALLMGFLWRVRGTHGWGSSWGLLNAGIIFILFITAAIGDRKKLNFGWTALTSLSFMITVPAWGTLLNQITGVLNLDEGFAYISPWSGVFMMLCLGFGVASVFGVMLGRGFSNKRWKFHHIIILVAVFFAAYYLAMATVSHWILKLVQPESVTVFVDELRKVGIDDSAYEAFMKHFDNDSWAKKFTVEALGRTSVAGRNYFQEIMTISSAVSAVAVLLATRFIIKDKRAALTGAVTCGAFAIAITVSDLFFYFGNGGYHMLQGNLLPENFAPWSLWEYFTGFIAGGIITAFLVNLKPQDDFCEIAFGKLPEKVANIGTFLLGFIGMIGITVVRPVLERFDHSDNMIIYTIIAVVATIVIVAVLAKKFGIALQEISYDKFCTYALPCFVLYTFTAYMFIGCAEYQNFMDLGSFHNILVTVSFALITIWSAVKIIKTSK